MRTAARQPLNLDAQDLRAIQSAHVVPLRDLIDEYRSRVIRARARLDEAIDNDAKGWRPPHSRVGTVEIERSAHLRAQSVLHHLLHLHQLSGAA